MISEAERARLVATILAEAKHLNRFVQKLLDMIRLSYGGPMLRRDWRDLRNVMGDALQKLADEPHDLVVLNLNLPTIDGQTG